jgi:hypothetical protein
VPVDEVRTRRSVAERYVELINRGSYHELPELFAENAVFLGPEQRVVRGRREIGEFYASFLPSITPNIRIVTYVEQGDTCVYELEARLAGQDEYRLGAIDHATFDAAGKITRFAVYTK